MRNIFWLALFCYFLFWKWMTSAVASNVSPGMGMIEIQINAGTPNVPSYRVVSASNSTPAVFRGFIESVNENNITIEKSVDPTDPSILIDPFESGIWGTIQARAKVLTLDDNGSIASFEIIHKGNGYRGKPLVFIDPPTDVNGSFLECRTAYAQAEWNSSSGEIYGLNIIDPGLGYETPPKITIDGGPAFLRKIENESNSSGVFFEIVSNSEDCLEINSSFLENPSNFLEPGNLIEVIPTHTVGSLFGFSESQLRADLNWSIADWVYFVTEPNDQTVNASDYIPIFNNGSSWRAVENPEVDYSNRAILPYESFIIARRNDSNLTINLHGIAQSSPTLWEIPEFGSSKLVGNPYPSDVMLSDLISNHSITEDNSPATDDMWLANPNPDIADNVQVLSSSVWKTYWNDGANLHVSENAQISARSGSGIGGSLRPSDFSMASGLIMDASNDNGDSVVITSPSHGLKTGFHVTISGALGRMTNEIKNQVDVSGNEVPDGEGLIIPSSINGVWKIKNTTTDTIELEDISSNSDFFYDGNATWSTGSPGAGYDSNVTLSILSENGKGAHAIGIVENGSINSISLISGGLLYLTAPKIIVHNGGWKSLTSGNTPIGNVTIPAGTGILLIRNHPHGTRNQILVGRNLNF